MLQRISRGFVLRKDARGRLGGFDQMGLTVRSHRDADATSGLLGVLGVIVLVLLAIALVMLAPHHAGTFAMAFAVPATTRKGADAPKAPAKIREMEANLKALAKELEVGQSEMAAGFISAERGEELQQKAQEMEDLQGHLDQYNSIAGITSKAREVRDVVLPGEREDVRRKSIRTTAGHLFVLSDAYKQYKQQGKQGWSAKVDIGRRLGKSGVTLRGEEAQRFEAKAFDPATLPDLGTDTVIYVDRDPEIVRFAEPEILTIRDVLNETTTTSDAIKYVRLAEVNRGAATVAKGGLKPFLQLVFEPTTVNVETIAVLSKVTEQDVDDAPRLVGTINGEMTLDVKVEEERQITWGSGVNELAGLFAASNNIPEFARASGGDTMIDTIRKMRTDLRKQRVTPNFVAIDPLDWETVELAKGTTDYYIWGLVSDLRGPRIWSLRVVESDAMTNLETGERRVLMGDGIRGATIYDRQQIQLAVGFMDDDFGRNLRTLRAEERLALAVKRPFAFEFFTTQDASS